ncbi:MAG: thiaminase II [Acidobacteria bacterium]|nr:thiaminase II [Acidobacteriota bacterium]
MFIAAVATPAGSFTTRLWQANQDIYGAILRHPFLKSLTDGTLPRETFAFYMIQDAHYLREFARALNVTAAKAPREEWAALLSAHAADAFREERKLHDGVFQEYGISETDIARTEPSPEALAYTSFLVATAYSRSFEESLGALLPCYWIYWEVGKELKRRGSSNAVYQKWIDNYASDEYGNAVQAVLEMANQVAASADAATIRRMEENFRRSARYEWMFWDSAFHRRPWPPAAKPAPGGESPP